MSWRCWERRLGRVLAAVSSDIDSPEENEPLSKPAVGLEPLLLDVGATRLAVRRATRDDAVALNLVTSYAFGASRSFQSIADDPFNRRNPRPIGEAQEDFDEQTWGAFEGDRAVSQLKAHAWTLSGGTNCNVAAVTGVATLPEFRRAGLLRTMMGLLFQDMVSRGQAVAALLASQAAIYRRFGYSEAVRDARSYSIDTVDVAFVDGDSGSYTVGREPMDASLEPTLRRLYKDFTALRAGCYDWDKGGWVRQAVKTQLEQGGMKTEPPWHCAVARDAAGEARGYCIYFLSHSVHTDVNALNHSHPTRNQMLTCRELIYSDIDAYRSLWSFLAEKHDLVGNIVIAKVPGDDPAPTIFLEPRLLRTKVEAEGSWWRIVDVKGALEARSYSTALGDTLTLAVEDDERLAPWNIGTWSLQVNELGAATVVKTTGNSVADIRVGVAELTSMWTGAMSATQLRHCDLLHSRDDTALMKAHLMFAMPKASFTGEFGW